MPGFAGDVAGGRNRLDAFRERERRIRRDLKPRRREVAGYRDGSAEYEFVEGLAAAKVSRRTFVEPASK